MTSLLLKHSGARTWWTIASTLDHVVSQVCAGAQAFAREIARYNFPLLTIIPPELQDPIHNND